MKKLIVALVVSFASIGAFAADAFLFGGTVNASSVGGTSTSSGSNSGAVLFGVATTGGSAQAVQGGTAGGTVSPDGVVVGQASGSGTQTTSGSGAFGFAAGGTGSGATAGNLSGATGTFGKFGLGINP